MRDNISKDALKGETIKEVTFGNPECPSLGSYGAYTLHMQSGRQIVITQCMGEIQFTEVRKK